MIVWFGWPAPQKEGRVRLNGAAFERWKKAVLDRDGWKCRRCDRPYNLSVHHIRKRSDLRLDTMENGITLCARCHDAAEGKGPQPIVLLPEHEGEPINANGIVRFRYRDDGGSHAHST